MTQSCIETRPILACFTESGGARRTIQQHLVYEGGQAIGYIYTDLDSTTPIDTSTGVVDLGECPVFTPDVEWERMCDIQDDGTTVEFMCQVVTSFDSSGAVIAPSTTNNYELDKVTPYAPTGTVGDCATECDTIDVVGTSTSWDSFKSQSGPDCIEQTIVQNRGSLAITITDPVLQSQLDALIASTASITFVLSSGNFTVSGSPVSYPFFVSPTSVNDLGGGSYSILGLPVGQLVSGTGCVSLAAGS